MATRIKNSERLNAKLKKLRTQTAPEVLKSVQQAARIVVDAQKALVPVESGDLRNSIHWEHASGGKRVNETRVRVIAGGDQAPYARRVEFGTPRQKANPFFFPGYRAVRRRVRSLINRAVKTAVKHAVT